MRGSSFITVSFAVAFLGCSTVRADPAPPEPRTVVIILDEKLGQIVAPIDTSAITVSNEMNILNVCSADCPMVSKPQRLSVVDGEPYSRELRHPAVDPDEIIGVTVFSGHDGAAMYGPRARDGLVVITTAHPKHPGCRPKSDLASGAPPREFIQIGPQATCDAYEGYSLTINDVLQDSSGVTKCLAAIDFDTIERLDVQRGVDDNSGARTNRGAIVIILYKGVKSPCDP